MAPGRASLPSWQPRLLALGNVALDVAHTGGVGGWVDTDLVIDEPALAYWLLVVLKRDVAQGPGLPDFRALRAAPFHCGRRHVSGGDFRPGDVDTINRLARGPALSLAMTVNGAAVPTVANVDQGLAHIAREGTALLRDRVREYAAQHCQLLFVDASRPGRRQWCSMARCGNIAKTRNYLGGNNR